MLPLNRTGLTLNRIYVEYGCRMSPKRYYTFMIEQELIDALKAGKDVTGLSEGGQIRQALKAWFAKQEIPVKATTKKTERKRVAARKRS